MRTLSGLGPILIIFNIFFYAYIYPLRNAVSAMVILRFFHAPNKRWVLRNKNEITAGTLQTAPCDQALTDFFSATEKNEQRWTLWIFLNRWLDLQCIAGTKVTKTAGEIRKELLYPIELWGQWTYGRFSIKLLWVNIFQACKKHRFRSCLTRIWFR